MIDLGAAKHYLRQGTELKVSRGAFTENSKKAHIRVRIEWVLRAENLRIWSAFMSGLLVFLFLIHAPVSRRFFYFFSCHAIAGKWFLRSDYSMACYSGVHAEFLPFVILAILVFTFTFPLAVCWQLFKRRKRLQSAINRQRYGFLYSHLLT